MKRKIYTTFLLFVSALASEPLSAQNALRFDGANDYVEAPAVRSINSIGTGDFTIEARIKASSSNSSLYPAIVSNRGGWSGSGIIVFLNTDVSTSAHGRLWANIQGINYPCSNSPVLTDDQCHHIAVVRQGGTLKFYIDGVLNTQRPIVSGGDDISSDAVFRIGHDYGNPGLTYFNGDIGEVRVWDAARSDEQIDKNKALSLSGSEANLKGYWKLNEGKGQTAFSSSAADPVDATLGSTAGTDDNDPVWATSCAGITPSETSTNALRFDGVDDYVEARPLRSFNSIGTGDFTIEARIKASQVNNSLYPAIVSNREYWSNTGIIVFLNTDVSPSAFGRLWANIQGTNYPCSNSPVLTDDKCHHIAVVRHGDTLKFYIDGVLNTQRPVVAGANNISSSATFRIGHDQGNPERTYFNGDIGEVRLWNTARTAQEIADNANKSLYGREHYLKGYWRMNEGTGQIAYSSRYSYLVHATLGSTGETDSNDPAWVSSCVSIPKKLGSTFENPVNIGVIAPGGSYTSTLSNESSQHFDNDYGQFSDDIVYKFTIAQTSVVTVEHCASGFDTYLHLLQEDKTHIMSDNNNFPAHGGPQCSLHGPASLSTELPVGTYYVVSEGNQDKTGNITTHITVSTPLAREAAGADASEANEILLPEEKQAEVLLVSPNPVSSGSLYFGQKVNRYVLTTIEGKPVAEGTNTDRLNIDGLAKGIYFINLDGRTQKVVVQ